MGSAMKTALIGASTAALLIVSVNAQTTASLPWGDPDLEGIWTNATLTTRTMYSSCEPGSAAPPPTTETCFVIVSCWPSTLVCE